MKNKYFIDSSILVNYVLVKLMIRDEIVLDLKLSKKKITLENIEKEVNIFKNKNKRNKEAFFSYKLIEKIKSINKKSLFCTSTLSLSEATTIIYELYCLEYMRKNRIPLRHFFHYKDQKIMNKKQLSLAISESIDLFLDVLPKVIFAKETFFPMVIALINKNNVNTHDAYLIGQALNTDCNFFITEDKRLKKKIKKINDLRLVNSEFIFNQIKKVSKSKKK